MRDKPTNRPHAMVMGTLNINQWTKMHHHAVLDQITSKYKNLTFLIYKIYYFKEMVKVINESNICTIMKLFNCDLIILGRFMSR
jgi:hypothetical protein